eukprot:2926104-Rhodomonas_salina.1
MPQLTTTLPDLRRTQPVHSYARASTCPVVPLRSCTLILSLPTCLTPARQKKKKKKEATRGVSVGRPPQGHCFGAVSYTHLTLPTICSV